MAEKSKILRLLTIFLFLMTSSLAFGFEEIAIHGFASTGFMKSDDYNYLTPSKEGSFEFNEMGINFNSSLNEEIRIGIQLYSYDLGDMGKNAVKLDWAVLDYRYKDALGVKVGKIKTPYGLYNEVQDYDMLRACILLPQGVYNKYMRETIITTQGVGVYGKFKLGWAGHLSYDLVAGTGEYDNQGGIAKQFVGITRINGINGTFNSGNVELSYCGRLRWEPSNHLRFSASLLKAETVLNVSLQNIGACVNENENTIPVYSAELKWAGLTVSGEYSQVETDLTFRSGSVILRENVNTIESYYGMAAYRFLSWFEFGVYYSVYYPNKDDRDGDNQVLGDDFYAWQKDTTLSLRFDLTDFWLVKLEAHFINGVALALVDNPEGCDDENWSLYAVKTTFSF